MVGYNGQLETQRWIWRNSLSKKGYNRSGLAVEKAASSRARPTMVNYGRDMLEEPFMGAIAQEENIRIGLAACTQVAPALGYDGSHTSRLDCFHNHVGQLSRIVNHDAAEPDIDRSISAPQEAGQIGLGLVCRCFAEKEPADIFEF
jgi:hypothetical protein